MTKIFDDTDYKKYNIVNKYRRVKFSFDTKTECKVFIISKLASPTLSPFERYRWFTMFRDLMFKGYKFLEYDMMKCDIDSYDKMIEYS